MERESAKRNRISLKQIEKLARLATELKLELLCVGDIKIVPSPASSPGVGKIEKMIKEATWKDGKPLSDRQKEDLLLFGMSGVVEDSDGE